MQAWFGSIYTDPGMWESALKQFKKEKCEFIAHVGDLTEGMSNRPDHIYQLSHIGYAAQKKHAREMLQLWPGKIYVISGNHDRWFIKNAGADIIEDVTENLPNVEYLGHDEGNISLKGKASLRLWHGEDGNSYAVSYRIQKVVESLTGGEKPNIMLFGHTHKTIYLPERNIHCYSLGSIQKQSKWMRGKRIKADTGFWIIDAYVGRSGGVAKITGTWYPFYQ